MLVDKNCYQNYLKKKKENKAKANAKANASKNGKRLPRRLRKPKKSRSFILSESQRKLPKELSKKVITPNNSELDKKLLNVLKYDLSRMQTINKVELAPIPISKKRNNLRVNLGINKQQNLNESKIMNVHDEIIHLPYEYPGDLWVHNNLEHRRDKPLEYFTSEHLRKVFDNYKRICYK